MTGRCGARYRVGGGCRANRGVNQSRDNAGRIWRKLCFSWDPATETSEITRVRITVAQTT